MNLAYRLTSDRDLALDVIQDTFLYLLEKFPGFKLTARLTIFLYPVVRHMTINQQRRTHREVTGVVLSDPATAGAPEPDPREELCTVLARLTEDHREVVLMRFVDGFSLAEIAEAFHIPLGTVKSRLHNAIGLLQTDPNAKKCFQA